uniref:Uncharacterized protein n=1 Tax=Arundo donax TaxID=35708 RepID=A0A0A9BGC7_ARUDO
MSVSAVISSSNENFVGRLHSYSYSARWLSHLSLLECSIMVDLLVSMPTSFLRNTCKKA